MVVKIYLRFRARGHVPFKSVMRNIVWESGDYVITKMKYGFLIFGSWKSTLFRVFFSENMHQWWQSQHTFCFLLLIIFLYSEVLCQCASFLLLERARKQSLSSNTTLLLDDWLVGKTVCKQLPDVTREKVTQTNKTATEHPEICLCDSFLY